MEKYLTEKPQFLNNINDLENAKSRHPIQYVCKNCGKLHTVKRYDLKNIERYKLFLCNTCYKSIEWKSHPERIINAIKHNTKHVDHEIMVNNVDDFKKLSKHQHFAYTCKTCGKIVHFKYFMKRNLNVYSKFLCRKCNLRSQHDLHPEWHVYDPHTQRNQFKYKYSDNSKFDSAWELALWIYAIDHNENIIREPCEFKYNYLGKIHTYNPDFLYKGKFIEIKGNQFFKNGKMICPYKHKSYSQFYINGLYEAKHQCGLDNGVLFWCKEEIEPYVKYVEDKYGIDYLPSFKVIKIPKDKYQTTL